MNKSILEQLELEKSKRNLIKVANEKKQLKDNGVLGSSGITPEGDQKFAWEYELERYRKDRIKDRFCIAGAICGMLALAITLFFNFSAIMGLFS